MAINPTTAGPFNLPVTFIFFSGFLSIFYILDFLLLAPLIYTTLTRMWPGSRPWQWALVGAALFALSVPMWELVIVNSISFGTDTIFAVNVGAVVGAVCCFILRRANPSSI